MTVISLELYDDAFRLNSALRNLDVQDEPSVIERMFPGFPQVIWEAEDDRGVKYYSSPGGGGGGGAEFRFESVFAPAISDEAKQLVLTCPEIQWMGHGPGTRSRIEFGPWRFEIPLG